MKKMMICLLLMLTLFAAAALAETDAIEAALLRAGIAQPVQLQQAGNVAACFAEAEGVQRLIVLEAKAGVWQIIINNPTALIPAEALPTLWLDNGDAIYWTYTRQGASLHFHSARGADGSWGPVDVRVLVSGSGDYTHEYATWWDDAHGGEIIHSYAESDENDNLLSYGSTMEYYPATWLGDCIRLADFDLSRFPCFDFDGGEWWLALNAYLREAAARMDSSRYAMVANPDPKDRLRLQERPDKGSLSQGKYYSGTPVLILNDTESKDWNQVMVGLITEGGQRGWMMKKFLTYGRPDKALTLNAQPMPNLSSTGEALKVYTAPQIGPYTLHWNVTGYTMKVIGVIGNEWYHVWFPATGEYGFVLQSDLWEGNG